MMYLLTDEVSSGKSAKSKKRDGRFLRWLYSFQ